MPKIPSHFPPFFVRFYSYLLLTIALYWYTSRAGLQTTGLKPAHFFYPLVSLS